MASIRKTQTTNQTLFNTIRNCTKVANKTGFGAYRAIAAKLAAPASQRAQVNLSKIEKNAQKGDVIIIPGKLLGTGTLSKQVTLVAFSASQSALDKLKESKSEYMTIDEYISKKPQSKVRIFK